MFKYIRRKIGEASFIHTDSFDDAEKAADPQAIGEFVEVRVNNVKINFIKVKKEKDDRAKDSSAKVQGSPREETQKVSGDKGTS
tara:strand:- start:1158 stop:1409 length:252 start_codon:yes stop_codon:yes gene_type:complete